jgi:hypothetical protein
MWDGVRTLRHIPVDEIGICDYGIVCPQELRAPCVKGGELSIIVTVQLTCYIYTTHIVIVVINAERDHYLFLLQITEGLPGLLCIGTILRWLLS